MVESQSSTFEPVDSETDYEFDDDPEYGRSSFLLIIGFIIVGIFFVGVIFFAYQQGVRTGEKRGPEIVTAEPGPVKITPTRDSNNDTAFEDSFVLNDDESTAAKSVLPKTEDPVTRPDSGSSAAESTKTAVAEESLSPATVPTLDPKRLTDAGSDAGGKEVPAPSTAVASDTAPDEAAPLKSSVPESAVDTASAAPEIKDVPTPAVAPEPEVTEPEPVEETPAATQPEPEPEILTPPATVAESAPKPAVTPPASAINPLSGSFVVQILSSPDQKQAETARQKFESKFSDMLSDHAVDMTRADLGAKGVYYRVRIGPFSDRDSAGTYCSALKARQQDCFVAKP